MNVVVALNETEPWDAALGPAVALATVVSGGLDIILLGGDPAYEAGARAFIDSAGLNRQPTIRYVEPSSGCGLFETWDQRETILVKQYGATVESAGATATCHGDWDGPTLLVPSSDEPFHRPYADRLIVVSPETGTFDSIEAWADRFGRHAGCHFVLLTVIAPDTNPGGIDLGRRFTGAHRRLGQIADRLRSRGVRTTWEVRMGDPAAEISRLAETTGTDLILLPKSAVERPEAGIIQALAQGPPLHLLIDA